MKDTTTTTAVENDTATTEAGIVTLSKTYTFEGKEYTQVDLRNLDDLTGADLIKATAILEKSGRQPMMKEMDFEYIAICAYLTTGLPVEFFKGLPAKDMVKIKNEVSGSFFLE